MAKSANLYARIEPELKEQAETILADLGIPASNAITMFYKQIILQRGLPFEVKLPSSRIVDVSVMDEKQMNAELEKGYEDILAGRTREASSVWNPSLRIREVFSFFTAYPSFLAPAMYRPSSSTVVFLGSSSPTISPSYITRIRSETVMTSSSSRETSRTALPASRWATI